MAGAPSATRPNSDERTGLIVAAALHALLIGWLIWHKPSAPLIPPPQRMTVTLAEAESLSSASESREDAAPAGDPAPAAPAPSGAEAPPPPAEAVEASPPEPEPAPAAAPEPVKKAAPTPASAPRAKREAPPAARREAPPPAPKAPTKRAAPESPPRAKTPEAPAPKPTSRAREAAAKPAQAPKKPAPRERREPAQPASARPVPTPAARKSPAAAAPSARRETQETRLGSDFLKGVEAGRAKSPAAGEKAAPSGASRLASDFLKGVGDTPGTSRTPPAAVSAAVQSSLSAAISRQLKPHWAAPQGVETEQLVTILAWSLNRDGSLAGAPRVVRQDGITDANRSQAARHAEQAVRAVRLAAPFSLPAEHYDAWKRVAAFRFDKRLAQ